MNILWDFDGTLFDTYPAYTEIVRGVLGDQKISDEEIYLQLKVSFGNAFQHFSLNEDQVKTVRMEARKLRPQDLMPFPEVEHVLKIADKNVIMTHKERDDVLSILSYHNLNGYFTDMVAGDDGFPRKPHTASYEFLHDKHKIDLVIGDRVIDILPAKKLGIRTCLFQNRTPGADYYLSRYKDFNKIIK
ncbi:phosphoglycolate phosphatase [Sporosarcina globispora]|uniref:Phosphoglycolate phosphatase n=1 Tax=Sporosarcina globispora TaxID=1459 RepID=A0A0M0GHH1_SPOGL|nr:HAD hydrolase-like protein [Sporosarcina globispora]KON89370.1 phosphoglycolate phosphatase [Sporosarcina globispora]